MKKKLFIFSNESIYFEDEKFFCDNIDIKSTPEGLKKKFEIYLFGRRSKKKRAHEIKIKKIKIFSNIFSFISEAIKSTKIADSKYLIISISPYTFLISLFLKIFGKTPIIYLRSDGYGEYKAILGKLGVLIYHLMFSFISLISNLISCRKYILLIAKMQGVPEILCNLMPEKHPDLACKCLDIDMFWKLNKPVWYTDGPSQWL